MKFLEENSTLFLATSHKAEQFTSNAIMSSFQDALEKSVIGKEIPRPKDANYKLQFVAAGIARLLIGWLQDARERRRDAWLTSSSHAFPHKALLIWGHIFPI